MYFPYQNRQSRYFLYEHLPMTIKGYFDNAVAETQKKTSFLRKGFESRKKRSGVSDLFVRHRFTVKKFGNERRISFPGGQSTGRKVLSEPVPVFRLWRRAKRRIGPSKKWETDTTSLLMEPRAGAVLRHH